MGESFDQIQKDMFQFEKKHHHWFCKQGTLWLIPIMLRHIYCNTLLINKKDFDGKLFVLDSFSHIGT